MGSLDGPWCPDDYHGSDNLLPNHSERPPATLPLAVPAWHGSFCGTLHLDVQKHEGDPLGCGLGRRVVPILFWCFCNAHRGRHEFFQNHRGCDIKFFELFGQWRRICLWTRIQKDFFRFFRPPDDYIFFCLHLCYVLPWGDANHSSNNCPMPEENDWFKAYPIGERCCESFSGSN